MIVLLAIGIFVLFGILLSQSSFDLPFLNPDTNQQLLFFAALSAVIFLLFVALTFVLARNLLKLFAERRLGVLGSKFRTRLVVAGLMLSLLPVIVMFWFTYGLMNRSIDKWFSRPVEEVREDTQAMAKLLSSYAAQNARAEARVIAETPGAQNAFATGDFSQVVEVFRQHEPTLQGGFALAMVNDMSEASFHLPEAWSILKPALPLQHAATGEPARFRFEDREYILGGARVCKGGMILVAMPLPATFSATVKQIETSEKRYLELSQQRRLVR